MNLLLNQKYEYNILLPAEEVRAQLKSITRTPWYDLAINLQGKLYDDDKFKLLSKTAIGIKTIGGMQDVAILKAGLNRMANKQGSS
jgi:hypothetical protein